MSSLLLSAEVKRRHTQTGSVACCAGHPEAVCGIGLAESRFPGNGPVWSQLLALIMHPDGGQEDFAPPSYR